MNRGYVKLWRKTIDSKVFADPDLFKLWCLCLLKANHRKAYVAVDGLREPVEVLPGQFITGRYSLHSEYYPKRKKNQKSPDTLWRWLKILENMGNLHIKSHSKYSVITIINWDSFQAEATGDTQQNAQQMHNRCTTDAQQMHTNKNDKNDKNEKNTNKESNDSLSRQVPHQKIIQIWNEEMPSEMLPEVKGWGGERPKHLIARCGANKDRLNPEWWRRLFQFIKQKDQYGRNIFPFLMGEVTNPGRKTFRVSLPWLVSSEENLLKVVEGFYARENNS
jgi:hypothetical protein